MSQFELISIGSRCIHRGAWQAGPSASLGIAISPMAAALLWGNPAPNLYSICPRWILPVSC